MFFRTFYILLIVTAISIGKFATKSNDWTSIEKLIEEFPFVTALLNSTPAYICTGTIIGSKTILTSGTCVTLNPSYVAVGCGVLSSQTNSAYIVDVAYTRQHADYNFQMRETEPNITLMHSNIGIVILTRPMIELYIPAATIGNYFASELQDIELTTVGYGKLKGTHSIALQYMNYNQAACINPKWYYCICGIEESSTVITFEDDFGNGAPVFFGSEVVGISATASGTLSLKSTGVKYNVFTVIGPYLGWIKKAENEVQLLRLSSVSNGIRRQGSLNVKFFCVLLVVNKMCN